MDERSGSLRYTSIATIAGRGTGEGRFRDSLRGVAVGPDGGIHAVGDGGVQVFDAEGTLLRRWATAVPGYAIAVDENGSVWVGESRQVEVFDTAGEHVDTWTDPERLGLVTAIGHGREDVFLADATARCIHRYDREGRFRNSIGDRHRKGGFHIPNGVVDFAVLRDGTLQVANPGMHRVEHYAPDGELLGRFGRFDGQDPAGFPGCCNPTNIAVDRGGRVVVSEKAGPRVKLYAPDGSLLAVFDDPGFDPGAKNMDIAFDGAGRILVVDTETLRIHVFAKRSPEDAG